MKPSFFFLFLAVMLGCTADRPAPESKATALAVERLEKTQPLSYEGMVRIPAGQLHMGGDNEQADPNEFPKHYVALDSFWLDAHEVTNRQFAEFVKATGYRTVAERPIDWEEMARELPPGTPRPPDSILQPGALVFQKPDRQVDLNNPAEWWAWTTGANWRHPTGPDSSIDDIMDHPVVQIAWEDARAYASWAGKRLPTEAEWEWAARGGAENMIYPWGNDFAASARHANFWQGPFPYINELADNFATTAPVKSFPPNGYGLYDMAGNVWEWCQDWFDISFYGKQAAAQDNTQGPARAFNPVSGMMPERIVRGGSFLCSEDYCSGYRNSRRMGSSPDTGLNHTGFRCAAD